MKKILKSNIPQKSVISTNFGKIDYCDSYRITKATNETIEQITENLFKLPKWVVLLMNLRNLLMKPFGLKADKNELGSYFPIIEKAENEIVMAMNDKHLNFRISVFFDKELSSIHLSTIVHYNNMGGKLYFFPVKPFHKIIVKSMLKRELKR